MFCVRLSTCLAAAEVKKSTALQIDESQVLVEDPQQHSVDYRALLRRVQDAVVMPNRRSQQIQSFVFGMKRQHTHRTPSQLIPNWKDYMRTPPFLQRAWGHGQSTGCALANPRRHRCRNQSNHWRCTESVGLVRIGDHHVAQLCDHVSARTEQRGGGETNKKRRMASRTLVVRCEHIEDPSSNKFFVL